MPWIIAGGAVVGGLLGAGASKSAASTQAKAARAAAAESARQFDLTRQDLGAYRRLGKEGLFSMAEMLGINPMTRPSAPNRAAYTTANASLNPYNEAILRKMGRPVPSATSFDSGGYNTAMADYQRKLDEYNSWAPDPAGALREDPGYQFRQREGSQATLADASARSLRLSPATQKALMRFNSGLASQEFGAAFNRRASLAGIGQSAATQTGAFGAANAANVGSAMMQGANAQAAGTVGAYNALGSGVRQAADIWSQQRMLDQYLQSNYGGGYGSGARANMDAYDLMSRTY